MTSEPWDFDYRPARPLTVSGRAVDVRWVFSTSEPLGPETIANLARRLDGKLRPVLEHQPLYWYELVLPNPRGEDELEQRLGSLVSSFRYAVSASRPSLRMAPPLEFSGSCGDDSSWTVRNDPSPNEQPTEGRWFVHDPNGANVGRAYCGTGAGTRLAVIDDEGRDSDVLGLDAEVALGPGERPRGAAHGAALIAWAVGTQGQPARSIPPFVGVAPSASPRLYLIPKPDAGMVWLPLAIATAVRDGADVVLCATYVEGRASPLLDDALTYAAKVGRRGRGAAVVMPTGREVSSPPGSSSASLTLRLGDPAGDPHVLCVAPSGRTGGWFLWKDKQGRLRPFANRGPAVRVAAPGDDMAYPFLARERILHAESSGASAVAAGVALLTLASNPTLTQSELYALLCEFSAAPSAVIPGTVADPADLLPTARDADGHDPQCGFGRVDAQRSCLAAKDPVCRLLIRMGDLGAAQRYAVLRGSPALSDMYSPELGRWAARAVGSDSDLAYRISVILKHLRLVSSNEARRTAHGTGALAKLIALAGQRLVEALVAKGAPTAVQAQAEALSRRARQATGSVSDRNSVEAACLSVACALWSTPSRRNLFETWAPGDR